MVYGYLRVSTGKQDADNQRFAILAYANNQKLSHVEFVEETVSGRISFRQRQLGKIIELAKTGDVIIVSELSRLGRSLLEVMEILSILSRQGVSVHAIKGSYILADDIQSKVLAFAFSLAAEVERELISSRTREALAKKKAEGKTLGRPRGLGKSKLDNRIEEIKSLLQHKVAKAAIARLMGTSRNNLNSFIAKRGLA